MKKERKAGILRITWLHGHGGGYKVWTRTCPMEENPSGLLEVIY